MDQQELRGIIRIEMNKYNYTTVRRIGLAILLVSIFLTNCKATVQKTGFVDLLDRYPKSLCVSIACCSGVTAGLTIRSIKNIDRLPRLGRAGAIVLSSAATWLYAYDHNADSVNQRIEQRRKASTGISIGNVWRDFWESPIVLDPRTGW